MKLMWRVSIRPNPPPGSDNSSPGFIGFGETPEDALAALRSNLMSRLMETDELIKVIDDATIEKSA